MRYLLDTGVLVRLLHRPDPQYPLLRGAIQGLFDNGHSFVMAPQNLVEFWSVCTRPAEARGGLGLSIDETSRRLRVLERSFDLLNEPASIYRHWRQLVTRHSVSGRQVHDARLAAVMSAYRVRRILTLNPRDFGRYPSIEPVTPEQVVS